MYTALETLLLFNLFDGFLSDVPQQNATSKWPGVWYAISMSLYQGGRPAWVEAWLLRRGDLKKMALTP